MEVVILVGIQASGKSTFFKQVFGDTHVRISRDMLRTAYREKLIFEACLMAKQNLVVDKTNLTRDERAIYIAKARESGFSVIGYYFRTDVDGALERNACRQGKARIPDKGILGSVKRLELPSKREGFDELYYVTTVPEGEFIVELWKDEV